MRLVVKCFLNLSHSRPNFSFVLILPEFFGVTLINKITRTVQRKSGDCECNYNGLHGWIPVDRPPHTYVSGLPFSNTSSACCTVCSPPKVKSPSITTYPPFTLLPPPPPSFPSGKHCTVVCDNVFPSSFAPSPSTPCPSDSCQSVPLYFPTGLIHYDLIMQRETI